MGDEYHQEGLFGLKEWVTLVAVVLSFYLYRSFSYLLPFTADSSGNTTEASVDDEARRRIIRESRRKLIEESERKLEENRQRLKEKEEDRRREQLKRAEKHLDISKRQPSNGSSTSLRRDYNPLMGDSASYSWRPAKRSSSARGA